MILLELFLTFLKIGAFTIGGGYAMIPLIQAEVVGHGWMELPEIIDFIAVSESTPGPIAINMATFIGSQTAGILGAVIATAGIVLPSFIIILLIAKLFSSFSENKIVKAVMSGIRPVVIGLIAASLFSVAVTVFFPEPEGFTFEVFKTFSFWISLVTIAFLAFLMKKKVNPILIIVIAAALGIGFGYLEKVI